MEIGGVKINSRLALAPMAGVTDAAFRQICSELGAGLTYTELVSAKALCYQDKKSLPLLELGEGDCVLLVSDGVCDAGDDDWVREKLLAFDGESPKELARTVMEESEARVGAA